MRAGDPVIRTQVGTDSNTRGLLPDIKVNKTRHLPFFVKGSRRLLEMAQEKHLFIEPEALGFRRNFSRRNFFARG